MDEELLKYIWLGIVAFIGSITGALTKWKKLCDEKGEKVALDRTFLFINIGASVFIAYITYEVLVFELPHYRLAIALSGAAAFFGSDFVINFITKKIER